MSRTPWYRWYPGDYLADTYALSWDADLLYRRILDALWTHETLPSDPAELAPILRVDRRKVRRLLPEILPLLTATSERLRGEVSEKSRRSLGEVSETSPRIFHPKMTAQRAENEQLRASRAIAGRKGGLARATLRARGPDPDPYNPRVSGLPVVNSLARAREASGGESYAEKWDRADAEAINRELEQKRASLGIDGERGLKKIKPGNPVTREDFNG